MLQHIRLDLLIDSALLEPGHIYVLQLELHTPLLRVAFSLGKQDIRFLVFFHILVIYIFCIHFTLNYHRLYF